jgi:prevent-host-death family protein
MKTISALTVRKKFGSIIDEVANKKIHITITRANRPMVVMLSFEDYEEIESIKNEGEQMVVLEPWS